MTTLRTFALILCAAALTACGEEAVQDITGTLPESRIKFFNFGVGAPSVNFYANDAKLTAVSSTNGTESTVGVAYGGVGSGSFYSAIDPGQYTFSGRISAATDKDLPISSVSTSLSANSAYSYYQSGFYNATSKTVEGFVVQDDFPAEIDYDVAYVRFVNAISNSQPMALFGTNTETSAEVPIGGAVAYQSAGSFVAIPGGVYNLVTRTTGSTSASIGRLNVSFNNGRVYTIGARGDMTVTSATAATRPILDFTANR